VVFDYNAVDGEQLFLERLILAVELQALARPISILFGE
jgi:hypothetical protein